MIAFTQHIALTADEANLCRAWFRKAQASQTGNFSPEDLRLINRLDGELGGMAFKEVIMTAPHGNMIEWIKEYRRKTGASLAEAKRDWDAIEAARDSR